MFTVVVDTSALYGDFHLRGIQALNLIDNIKKLGGELIIPEIVVDEAERKFTQLLRDSTRELKKSAKVYRQLTGIDIDIPEVSESPKEITLRQRLLEVSDHIAPYPQFSHQQVVRRLLAGYRPFSVNGDKGYRDFLIWLSVLQIAAMSTHTVIFITSNSSDFCAKKDNQLHEDLIADLQERNIPSTKVVITQSLSFANREYLEKNLDIFAVSLNEAERKHFINHAQTLLRGNLLNDVTKFIPKGIWNSISIAEFDEPPDIIIEAITSIGAGTNQITASFKGIALVDISVPFIEEIDPLVEFLNFTNMHIIEPEDVEDEFVLIYGYTQISGTLVARLPNNGKSIEGVTVEDLTIDGIIQ